jgi:hypothetical protein
MPTPTYTNISSITLAASSGRVDFSNIPQNYKDLILIATPISGGTYTSTSIQFNSDTGTNYSSIWAVDGQSSFSGTYPQISPFWSGWAVNGIIMQVIQVMDYSATDKHKSTLARTNKFDSEGNAVGMSAHRWSNTSPINTLSFFSSGTYGQPFAAGSKFTLYGIVG